ncbi:MAG: hypothetical protein ACON49_09105 [Candidatus Puniceispirillaceae bacterium]
MADIIDEINEEIKQERMQALFAKYGKIIIGFAAAVVAIVVALQGYGMYQDSVKAKAATAYFDALGEDEIGAALKQSEGALNAGYSMLSQFVTAAELVGDDQQADAYDIYANLARDNALSDIYRDFAAMLAVTNAPASISTDELVALIQPVADKAGPTQGLALELRADLALRDNDIAAAKTYLEQITQLQDIPNGLRQRAATLALVLDSKE